MILIKTYCRLVANIVDKEDVDKVYHDQHYGKRVEEDNELFGRLVMEINQAGLSWRTILNKEPAFRKAYHNFDIQKVANYKEEDCQRLLNDVGIIRNKLKINAVIYNAGQILEIQKEFGGFRQWLDVWAKDLGQEKELWLKLFKKNFKFVGGEIVGEFLTSLDMLPGAHDEKCLENRVEIVKGS